MLCGLTSLPFSRLEMAFFQDVRLDVVEAEISNGRYVQGIRIGSVENIQRHSNGNHIGEESGATELTSGIGHRLSFVGCRVSSS